MTIRTLALLLTLAGTAGICAWAGPRTEDLATEESVLKALYSVISGPAGAARDWDRFRNLFIPGARLVAVSRPDEKLAEVRVIDVEGYIRRATPRMEKSGFFERELARSEVRFGAMVHAFSTYESRHEATDVQPYSRGINSVQLFFDGSQWRIVTIYWDSEGPERPIPAEFLPRK